MFVVHVPERRIAEYVATIGDLEADRGVEAIGDRLTDVADEPSGVDDVLERHLAREEVGLTVAVRFGVEVGDEVDLRVVLHRHATREVRRIEAEPGVLAQFAQQHQELAVAAPDLDDLLAVEIEAVDHVESEAFVERVERGGVSLGRLITARVLRQAGIERRVVHMTAARAVAEANVARRQPERLLGRVEEQNAVRRHSLDLVEDPYVVRATTRAGMGDLIGHERAPRL